MAVASYSNAGSIVPDMLTASRKSGSWIFRGKFRGNGCWRCVSMCMVKHE
jgi:hypothetical protein